MDSNVETESSSGSSSCDSESIMDLVDETVLADEHSEGETSFATPSTTKLANRERNDTKKKEKIKGSIHRLSIRKLRDYLNLAGGQNLKEEDMISMLVRKCNKDRETNKHGVGTFREQVKARKKKILQSVPPADKFSVRLYIAQSGSIPSLLDFFRIQIATGDIHIVCFIFRPGDIFAITTNQGYHLVHEHCEFNFPRKIANRLCTEKGPRVFEKRLLVGPNWAESKVKKSNERQSVRDFPSLYTNFKADLREDASIRNVSTFRSPVVQFNAASVQFPSGIVALDLAKILDHFSTIAKDRVTYQFPTDGEDPVEEESLDIYDGYLKEVTAPTYMKLQEHLTKQFSLAAASGHWYEFPFDLGYKHHLDFALAQKFAVQIQHKICGEPSRKSPWLLLPLNPSLTDIGPYLKRYVPTDQYPNNEYPMSFLTSDVQIMFTTAENYKRQDSLMSFFEGEVIYEGRVYSRTRNNWYEQKDVYVAEGDRLFVELLNKHIDLGNTHLTLKWPARTENPASDHEVVRAYIEKYVGQHGFFFPPAAGKALFDLMYMDADGQLWIYFIACNFMGHTPRLSARMHNCLEEIKIACGGNPKKRGAFGRFFDEYGGRSRLGENFEIFQQRLKQSNVIYALGPSSDYMPTDMNLCSRTLWQEKDRKLKITEEVLQDELKPFENTELTKILGRIGPHIRAELLEATARFIHEFLRNNQYIDGDDMATMKFLYCTENTFEETEVWDTERVHALYSFLSRFQSGFKSLRARFELRYIAQNIVLSTSFFCEDIESED